MWGFYDRSGKLAITPVYKEVDDFSEGMAAVLVVDKELQKERWGFIDTAGNVMIEPAFKERPYRFSEGYVVVQTSNGLYQMIDKPENRMEVSSTVCVPLKMVMHTPAMIIARYCCLIKI